MKTQKTANRITRAAGAFILLALTALFAGAAQAQQPAPAQPPPTPAAQEGFVPVDQLAPKEEMPAAPLVMAAYAVAWLVIFGYVWSLWRRIHKVETEIADVSKRLASGARR
ncbi:MAG TPA: CcmD family protein [Vicinamibacterales bacterium]|nr:CcmD family protein [Vicinamibacterales bacterium]